MRLLYHINELFTRRSAVLSSVKVGLFLSLALKREALKPIAKGFCLTVAMSLFSSGAYHYSGAEKSTRWAARHRKSKLYRGKINFRRTSFWFYFHSPLTREYCYAKLVKQLK